MWKILTSSKKQNERDAKQIVLKEFFNYAVQKKAVKKAARESARDQQILVSKYRNMRKSK